MHWLIAILLANLPRRWWGPFEDRFPLFGMAWLSGLVAILAGFAVAIPGFLTYIGLASGGLNEALLGAQSDLVRLRGPLLLALPAFLLTTPAGLLATYLIVSGLGRFASAFITNEPHGDWILTSLDAVARHVWRDTSTRRAVSNRERREGPEVPDRLVTGAWLGRDDVDLAIVASRRKGWPPGAYLVTADGKAYRVGPSFDLETKAGLRAVYPLTELTTVEAIRHAIAYELPAMWRAPRQ